VRRLSNVDSDTSGVEAGKGYLRQGTPELRRVNLALFVAGLATLDMLYCTQPLLPVFSPEFGVTPAVASLSESVPEDDLRGKIFPLRGQRRAKRLPGAQHGNHRPGHDPLLPPGIVGRCLVWRTEFRDGGTQCLQRRARHPR